MKRTGGPMLSGRQGTPLTVGAVAHRVFQQHVRFLSRFLGHFNCHVEVLHPLAHLQAGTARQEAQIETKTTPENLEFAAKRRARGIALGSCRAQQRNHTV